MRTYKWTQTPHEITSLQHSDIFQLLRSSGKEMKSSYLFRFFLFRFFTSSSAELNVFVLVSLACLEIRKKHSVPMRPRVYDALLLEIFQMYYWLKRQNVAPPPYLKQKITRQLSHFTNQFTRLYVQVMPPTYMRHVTSIYMDMRKTTLRKPNLT